MKELSIEEKAKAYDEALERAKKLYEQGTITESLSYVFPELKESEDERIRKALITFFNRFPYDSIKAAGTNAKEAIAWLEKQGEQKQDPCNNCKDVRLNCHNFPCTKKRAFKQGKSALEVINEEKVDNANKVEPMFHEGEWITNGDYTGKIVEVKPLYYILQSQDGNIVDDTISHVDKQFHSFTIKDAKAGDVLVIQETDFAYESIFIFNKIENNHIIQYLHYFITDKGEEVCKVKSVRGFIGFVGDNVHPATKEQREQLENAMTDAGYAFNFEKKELKKVEKKSSWSEEDEMIALNIEQVMNCASLLNIVPEKIDKIRTWLKSFKERYTWQPSDEQMEAFEHFVKSIGESGYSSPYDNNTKLLYSLLEQLKKLK